MVTIRVTNSWSTQDRITATKADYIKVEIKDTNTTFAFMIMTDVNNALHTNAKFQKLRATIEDDKVDVIHRMIVNSNPFCHMGVYKGIFGISIECSLFNCTIEENSQELLTMMDEIMANYDMFRKRQSSCLKEED